MNLITMTNITKVYNDGDMQFTALHPTEFYLNDGEFVAIIGPSGSGKTTFLSNKWRNNILWRKYN